MYIIYQYYSSIVLLYESTGGNQVDGLPPALRVCAHVVRSTLLSNQLHRGPKGETRGASGIRIFN